MAAENGCSLLAVLLTAYAQVLGRRLGREEVIVVVPCTTRRRAEEKTVIGPLFNLLPLRLRNKGSFRGRLARVGQQLNQALEQQQYPFWNLVEELRPRSAQGRPPFSDAALSLLPGWGSSFEVGGLTLERIQEERMVGPFGVTLSLAQEKSGLQGGLQYEKQLLDPEEAQAWTQEFVETLQAGLLDPGSRFSLYDPPFERMEAWFSAQARATPGRAAVLDEGGSLTYRELDTWSDRLAAALPPEVAGQPVGLFCPPSSESVVAWLAVLKRGGVCLPLDPVLPVERLRWVGEDSGCRWVLTTGGLRSELPFGEPVLIDGELPEPGKLDPAEGEVAYQIYTSGSQGSPQGVLGTHRGVLHRAAWMSAVFPWEAEERCLLRTPPSFVDSVNEWFAPLVAGAALVPYRQGALLDPDDLMQFLHKQRVTRMTMVPGLLGLLLSSPHHFPGRLRLCISSGGDAAGGSGGALSKPGGAAPHSVEPLRLHRMCRRCHLV